MTASVPMVRLENVSHNFDDGAVVALCDVSLSTYANDCVAILGKSGSGESTLIHILSGCDEATTGRVYWREEPVRDQRTWRKLRAFRKEARMHDLRRYTLSHIKVRSVHSVIEPFKDIEDARALAQAIVDTVREPLLVLDGDLRARRQPRQPPGRPRPAES
jgi:ABC-type methionine transport system ATPase subunit